MLREAPQRSNLNCVGAIFSKLNLITECEGHLWTLIQKAGCPFKRPGQQVIVGREKQCVLRRHPLKALVIGVNMSFVNRVTQKRHPAISLLKIATYFWGTIRRGIVDNQHSNVVEVLAENAIHAFSEEVTIAIAWNDNIE
jgi:hypothetical protein